MLTFKNSDLRIFVRRESDLCAKGVAFLSAACLSGPTENSPTSVVPLCEQQGAPEPRVPKRMSGLSGTKHYSYTKNLHRHLNTIVGCLFLFLSLK